MDYHGGGIVAYSKQTCNGVTIENKDGQIYINGRHIETGKRTFASWLDLAWIAAIFFMIGCGVGTM